MQTKVRKFIAKTGHDSEFTILFKFIDYLSETENFPAGEVMVTGYSNLVKKDINFCGIGTMPTVESDIAVAVTGQHADGTDIFETELIVYLEEVI